MSPELWYLFTLAVKMAVSALFVIGATVLAERTGPFIGALIATLPIAAGPSYVFLALDHNPDFIAASALVSFGVNIATGAYALAYVFLAQRYPPWCLAFAFVIWLALALVIRSGHWGVVPLAVGNIVVYGAAIVLTRRFREAPMPRLPLRFADVLARGALVALLVAAIVTLSFRIGPQATGILAVAPVLYTSIMLVLHLRVGGPASAAVIANGFAGLGGFGLGVLTLHYTAVPLGNALALSLALAVCIAWNLMLWIIRWLGAAGVTAAPLPAKDRPL